MFLDIWRKRLASGILGTVTLCAAFGNSAFADDWNDRPVGSTQIEFRGKLWPPFPRPVGKEARCIDQYHYTHYWPYPQNCEDRSSVRTVLNYQAANGWVEATTLFNFHFTPDTHQLNSAGVAHLEYILFRVPTQYRTAFIQNSGSMQSDQIRVANVQAAASSLLNDGSLPPIALRRARSYGASAAEVDMIGRKYILGTPTPRLPAPAAAGGASGGGAASAE
jgi:hypothetical protein